LDRQSEQQGEKERREKERFEIFIARLETGKERAVRVKNFNSKLTSLTMFERLQVIASSDMPLEAVCEDLLVDGLDAAASVDSETRSKLLQVIDRRNRGVWGCIRRALVKQ
jgi:hypothetical protein